MFNTLLLFAAATAVTLFLLYKYVTRKFKYWKVRNVPYMKPVPIFGSIFKVLSLKMSIGEYVRELYNTTTAPFIGFFVSDQPFLLLRDLDLIKHCLIKNFVYFDDRSVTDNQQDDPLGANILFVMKNPAWRIVRRNLTPAFSSGKMRNLFNLMQKVGDDLVQYLGDVASNEKQTNTREVCMKYTTNVISSCAFGINAECFKHEQAAFRVTSKRIFEHNLNRKIQMGCYFFAPMLVKIFKMKFIEPDAGAFIKKIYEETVKERENTISKTKRNDLIDILIQIKSRENNTVFDENMLVACAVQFFIAGFETTGSTLSFALYNMALLPDLQTRLRDEIKTTLKTHGSITYDAIKEMTYLDMVVKETLRLYPVLPYLDRRCNTTHVLPGTDLTLEKGIPIYISLLGLHNNPQYFPNPEKFDPERFSPKNRNSIPKYCYLPFGDGPRNCIGGRFGLLSAKMALIRILNDFEVEPSEETPIPLVIDPNAFLLSPDKNLYLHFKKVPVVLEE